jgi:hypothetical protein
MIPVRIRMNASSTSTWLAEELSGAAYLGGTIYAGYLYRAFVEINTSLRIGPSFTDPKRGAVSY